MLYVGEAERARQGRLRRREEGGVLAEASLKAKELLAGIAPMHRVRCGIPDCDWGAAVETHDQLSAAIEEFRTHCRDSRHVPVSLGPYPAPHVRRDVWIMKVDLAGESEPRNLPVLACPHIIEEGPC